MGKGAERGSFVSFSVYFLVFFRKIAKPFPSVCSCYYVPTSLYIQPAEGKGKVGKWCIEVLCLMRI